MTNNILNAVEKLYAALSAPEQANFHLERIAKVLNDEATDEVAIRKIKSDIKEIERWTDLKDSLSVLLSELKSNGSLEKTRHSKVMKLIDPSGILTRLENTDNKLENIEALLNKTEEKYKNLSSISVNASNVESTSRALGSSLSSLENKFGVEIETIHQEINTLKSHISSLVSHINSIGKRPQINQELLRKNTVLDGNANPQREKHEAVDQNAGTNSSEGYSDHQNSRPNFLVHAIKDSIKKSFKFSGRTDRKTHWMFLLGYILIAIALIIPSLIYLFRGGSENFIYNMDQTYFMLSLLPYLLIFFYPAVISSSVRRLHDIDRSGWWLWIGLIPLIGAIILLVWTCKKGDEVVNQYGKANLQINQELLRKNTVLDGNANPQREKHEAVDQNAGTNSSEGYSDHQNSRPNFLVHAIKDSIKKSFKFSGRTDRKTHWMFLLGYILIAIALIIPSLIYLFRGGSENFIYNMDQTYFMLSLLPYLLIFFYPAVISSSVRRLHDIDRSGWWLWIGLIPLIGAIILLVWTCKKGDEVVNQYGKANLH